MDKIKVVNTIKCPTGHYFGTIVETGSKVVESKKDKSTGTYKQYWVEVEHDVPGQARPRLEIAFPKYMSAGSGLGKFFKKLEIPFKADQEIDLDAPKGMKLEFDVVNTPTANGTFSNISEDTILVVKKTSPPQTPAAAPTENAEILG